MYQSSSTEPEGSMEQVVTFTGVEEKAEGEGKHGPWKLRVFTAGGGGKYQTFSVELGDKALGFIGKPALVTYEIEDRQYQDREGNTRTAQNNVIKKIEAADGVPPDQIGVAAAPQRLAAIQDKDARITRQWAVNAAIATVAAGILKADSPNDVLDLSKYYIEYAATGKEPGASQDDEPQF